jgi:hypothetical protein
MESDHFPLTDNSIGQFDIDRVPRRYCMNIRGTGIEPAVDNLGAYATPVCDGSRYKLCTV